MKARFANSTLSIGLKLALVLVILSIPLLLSQPVVHASVNIPVQTDDGLDPVNLVFTGSASASWVAQNLQGWNPTPCSEPKTLDGKTYDFNMETPDTRNQAPPCWGPRYHIRIWDMGTDPVLGHWSIGAAHYEHTECSLTISLCHHVIDSWERAEARIRATFASGTVALSISSYPLNNSGRYQGIYNDGNATMIQLSPTNLYSVTFQETGLPEHTPWSVILNGTTRSSTDGNITVRSQKGAYSFTVGAVPGYRADVSTGDFNLTENRTVPIRFTSTQTIESVVDQPGVQLFLITTAAAWSAVAGAVVFKRVRKGRMKASEI